LVLSVPVLGVGGLVWGGGGTLLGPETTHRCRLVGGLFLTFAIPGCP